MSSIPTTRADPLRTSSPETPPPSHDLPTTSFTVKNSPQHLRPTEPVACMNCPAANWMLKGQSLEAYCRILYMHVWQTSKPGKILICDAQELARLAAEAQQDGMRTLFMSDIPAQPETAPAPKRTTAKAEAMQSPPPTAPAPTTTYNEVDPFGLASLPAPKTTVNGSGFL